MKNLFNLLGIVLISISIVSCGEEENNESTKPSINQDQKLENEKESVEKIKPKCASDAKEFQINNNIISSLTLSKIECKENDPLYSEIEDLLTKDNQLTFIKNQENEELLNGKEGYKTKIDGTIKISENEYNASLYYTPMKYEERIEFDGILAISLDKGKFIIKIRGSKKK